MKAQLTALFLLLFIPRAWSQLVQFPAQATRGHIAYHDLLKVAVDAPLDTNSGHSDSLTYAYLLNGSYMADHTVLTSDSLILKKKAEKGLQALYFHFLSDSTTRLFAAFITSDLSGNATQNFFERLRLPVSVAHVDSLVAFLKQKMAGTDSATLISSIPLGLKCMAVLDFFAKDGTDSLYASVTQYEFAASAASGDLYIRGFCGEKPGAALFDLLSAGWQMSAADFKGNIQTLQKDAFAATDGYHQVTHSNAEVNRKIVIAYSDSDPRFRRIILFINND